MHHAARNNHIKVVEVFLNNDRVIDKNPKNENGETPMHKAAKEGHEDIIELFLNAKWVTDKNPSDHKGKTVIQFAKDFGKENVIELYGQYGIKISDENKDYLSLTKMREIQIK